MTEAAISDVMLTVLAKQSNGNYRFRMERLPNKNPKNTIKIENIRQRKMQLPGFGVGSIILAISLRFNTSLRISLGTNMAEESCVRGCILTTFADGPGYTCTDCEKFIFCDELCV